MKTIVNLSIALTMVASIHAVTITVPFEQPTIQAGINAANAGDTVLVASGTYFESNIQLKADILLTSETGTAECATIDAECNGRVIELSSCVPATTVRGFTITGGCQEGLTPGDGGGAGLLCVLSHLDLVNCTVVGNTAGISGRGAGAGVHCNLSTASFMNCDFQNNSTPDTEPGGGVYVIGASATFDSCSFRGNSAGNGGGLCAVVGSSIELNTCLFSDNVATHSGGAISISNSAATIRSSTLVGNNSADGSAIVGSIESHTAIENTIIAFGRNSPSISCHDESSFDLTCCDIFGNTLGDWDGCVSDQANQNDNFSLNPVFCNVDAGDFSLWAGSPCAPTNNLCGTLVGALPVRCSSCCVNPGDANHNGGSIPADISDLTYFIDYMFGASPAPVCTEEFDNDGNCTLDISDLTYFVDYLFGGGPAPVKCHVCP